MDEGTDGAKPIESPERKNSQNEKDSTAKTLTASRIGRPCLLHSAAKPALPPLDLKKKSTMHRQTDDTIRSMLPDVFEESEADLLIDRFGRSSISITRFPTDERKPSSGSLGADLYLEATGARRSSDTGTVLTTDTDSFMIGQRVWVGGIKPGQIAYIGETHFAPGDWAGIVLDEPNGKNDGCVAGKRYFQCEPKKGIFSRLTRLTLYPLPAALLTKESSPDIHARSILTPERSRTVSPTSSIRSSSARSPAKHGMTVGDRVIVSSGFGSRPGILKYIGETKFAQGNWCGVQLDEPTGKNDGSVDGVRYFECPAKHGIFVPIAKVSLSPTAKKTRLSRAGSRESLTSVGTLNSIATTNTSRLRMSSQKIPAPKKPVNPTRSNYSLQDIIREKQNHIEQIMIERELDREDSQNQALNFQKKIFESKNSDLGHWAKLVQQPRIALADLRRQFRGWSGNHEEHCILHNVFSPHSKLTNRITELESQLQEEKKKSEDLQNSVDEATFCGDELTVQTQVYKEKIIELESHLESLSSNKSTTSEVVTDKNYDKSERSADKEVFLKEETKYLLNRIQELEKELVSKDENYDKLISSIKELEALNLELVNKCDVNNDEITRLKAKIKEKISLSEKLQVSNNELKENRDIKDKNDESITEKYSEEKHEDLVRALKLNDELAAKESEALTKIKCLENQMAKMKIEYDNIISKYVEQIKTLEAEVMILRGDISNKDSNISALQEKGIELKEALLKLHDLEQKLSNQNVTHEGIVDALKKHTEAITSDNEKYKMLISEYEEKLATSQKTEIELKEALQKIAAMEAQLTAKENDIRTIKEDYENKSKLWKAENENLEFLLNEKEIALKTLQDDMLSKNDAITNNINKITELESIIAAKGEECKNLQNELENTRMKCKESDEVRIAKESELSSLAQKFSELTKEYELLNQKFSDQKTRHEYLLQEVNNLKNSSTTSQSEIISLTAHLAEKEEAHAKLIEDANARRVQLENELQKITSRNETLQDQLNKVTAEKEAYVNNCKQYETEKSELERSVQNMKDQINSLQQTLMNVEKGSKEKVEELVKTLQAQIDKEITEKDTYLNKCKQYETEKSELQRSVQGMKEQINALQQDLINVEKESKQKEEEIVKTLQAQLNKEVTEKDTYHSKCKQYECEKLEFEKSVENLNDKIKAMQQDFINLEKSFKQKEEELVKALQVQLDERSIEKDTYENKCKNYESEKLELQKSIENLKEQINTLQLDVLNVGKSSKEKEEELMKSLQAQLNKEMTEKDSVVNKYKQSESEKMELEKTVESLKNQISVLQQDLTNVKQGFKNREEELTKTLQDQLNKELTEKDMYENKCKQYENEKLELETSIEKLKEQVKVLQQDHLNVVKQYREREEEFVKQNNNLIAENKKYILSLGDKEKEVVQQNLMAEEKTQMMIENLKMELSNKDKELERLKTDMQVIEKSYLSSNEELKKVQATLSELSSNREGEIEKIKQQLKEIEEEQVDLVKENHDLKEQLTCLEKEKDNIVEKSNIEIQGLRNAAVVNAKLLEENEELKKNLQKQKAELNDQIATTTAAPTTENVVNNAGEPNRIIQSEHSKCEAVISKLEEHIKYLSDKLEAYENLENPTNEVFQDAMDSEPLSQINFLNSIIADMQQKNDTLKAKIDTLENFSKDFNYSFMFENLTKRKPAPRVFCDMCDQFDLHDTEDCPIQCSESPVPFLDNGENRDKEKPPPRKYCESCEVFGHEASECAQDETY